MRQIFYRGNFCSECGIELERRWSFLSSYLCPHCRELIRPGRTTAIAVSTLLFLIAVMAALRPESRPGPPVSAFIASPGNPAKSSSPRVEKKAFCGARTRKGTPCRRLVQPGSRCSQHAGRPSIIEPGPEVE